MRVRRKKRLIGLDIGSSAIKAIELQRRWNGLRATAIGLAPVPQGSIVEGRIIDAAAVAHAIRTALHERFGAGNVATALSSTAVMVRRLSLPPSAPHPAQSIRLEIEKHFPFTARDLRIDFAISATPGDTNDRNCDVLVVAAKKDHVNEHVATIAACGRSADVVDIDTFALQNAYYANYGLNRGSVTTLIDVGASAIKVNVIDGARSIFTREVLKNAEGFALDHPVHDIVKTVDSLRTVGIERPDRILLSGGGLLLDNLRTALQAQLAVKVEPFDPFRRIARTDLGGAQDAPGLMAVAVGLALRYGDEQ